MSDSNDILGESHNDFGGSWKEKQQFMVRFLDELGAFIDKKMSEFELPPVVIVGALEVLKNEYMQASFEYIVEEGEDDDDEESELPFDIEAE